MPPPQPLQILLIVAACLLIGLSKGGLGGPIPVTLTTPLLSAVMPVSQAVSLVLPLLILADVFALWAYWRAWDMRYVRLMLPAAVLGVALGLLLLTTLPDLWLRRLLGLFTLVVIVYKIGSSRIARLHYQPRGWHGQLAGGASGFASALANTGAPPFTAYMLLKNVTPVVFIANTTLLFAIVNAIKLPGILLMGVVDVAQIINVLWVLPLIPPGIWLGRKFVDWVDPKVFEQLMIVLLTAASLALLFSAPR